ncbi:MAG: hypothetical protein OES47_14110 [Acidobacteriota bacterium]|nr:hypothetical protein [Acidobacteriota bacterium]
MVSHLDYRGVLERASGPDSEAQAFALHLGDFDLEPISYSTLRTLSDCPETVRQALRVCFLERPVLWSNLTDETLRHCTESLKDLYGLLRAVDERLLVAGSPKEGFYSAIIERWLDLTRKVVGDLRRMIDSGESDKLRPVIGEYRREACACVEALVQFLPPTDPLAGEVRVKLEHGDEGGAGPLGFDREGFDGAHWSMTSSAGAPEESGFVTWGVP